MSVAKIPVDGPHPLGWVPTRLELGDELGDQPGHDVSAHHSLQELYGLTPRAVVEGNGVKWNGNAINAWVLRTGGTKLANGQAVFSDASVIFLPPDGPRPPASGDVVGGRSNRNAKILLGVLAATPVALAAIGAARRRRSA